MAEPSLSEIVSIKGDADLAYGTSGVGGNNTVIPFNEGLQFLAHAAQEKAQSDIYHHQQYQQRLNDFFKNFKEVDVEGIMQKDYPEISTEYASLANDIADNIDAIRNPASNQDKYTELKRREAELRAKVAQSKMDVGQLKIHQDYIRSHPEVNTEETAKKLEEYQNLKLGERPVISISTPTVFEPIGLAKVANEVAEQKLTQEKQKGRYLVKEDETNYLQSEYKNAWHTLLNSTDKSGRTLKSAAEKIYQNLPPEVKDGMDFDTWIDSVGESLRKQDDKSQTIKVDPVAQQEDTQAHQRSLEAQKHANRMGEIRSRADLSLRNQRENKLKATKEDEELLLDITAKAFLDRTGVGQKNVFNKSKGKDEAIDVVPLSKTELNVFAREEKKPSGATEMIAPAFVTRRNGLLTPYYLSKKRSDGTNEYQMGAQYTPEKFMSEFAKEYYSKSDVPELLNNAKKRFQTETNSATIDDTKSLEFYMNKNDKWSKISTPEADKKQEKKKAY